MQHLDTKEIICLFNVYVPNNSGEKNICWDFIKNMVDLENLENTIITGDLNLTLLSSEKRIGCIVRDLAREWVKELMQDWYLLDIKPSSEARMHILHSNVSDHKPIRLELLVVKDLGPIPFRFSPLWIKEADFMQKLASDFSQPCNSKKKIQSSLELHHLQLQETEITKEDLDKETQLQHKFHKACLAEEEYWRLKSRNLWLKAGDRNSSFFHKQSQVRKFSNFISEIKKEIYILKDIATIKKVASDQFKNVYSEGMEVGHSSKLLDVVSHLITARMNQWLEAKVNKNEVKDSLFGMDPEKALGPDGFTANFLQSCWQIVENEFLKMILKSQDFQKIGGCTNSAFLALIPMEKGENSFNRFHPISLCNIGYKAITKVIAHRLKNILPKIILEKQEGFIHGRHIMDNFILVQEAIHSSMH
eukprot:PITA_35967